MINDHSSADPTTESPNTNLQILKVSNNFRPDGYPQDSFHAQCYSEVLNTYWRLKNSGLIKIHASIVKIKF